MSLLSECEDALTEELTERVHQAEVFMKADIRNKVNKAWSTGALEASIHTEKIGEWTWRVGSSLDYAYIANYGRGVVKPKNSPSLYLKGLDFWMPPGRMVRPAWGDHFLEATKNSLG